MVHARVGGGGGGGGGGGRKVKLLESQDALTQSFQVNKGTVCVCHWCQSEDVSQQIYIYIYRERERERERESMHTETEISCRINKSLKDVFSET